MNLRRGRSPRRGRRRNAEFQLATTSDVAFLLLIFFISTAIFVSPYGLPIVLPPAGAEPLVVAAEDVLLIELDAGGGIAAGGSARTRAQLAGWVREVRQNRPDAVFRMEVHPLCPYQGVIDVVDTLRGVGAERVHFGVQDFS